MVRKKKSGAQTRWGKGKEEWAEEWAPVIDLYSKRTYIQSQPRSGWYRITLLSEVGALSGWKV